MKWNQFTRGFLGEMGVIAQQMANNGQTVANIEQIIEIVMATKTTNGRVFFAGVGGGAGSGSHATNDFNKIAGVATICLSDNPSLVTALWNDEGASSIFQRQLEMHHFGAADVLFVFSVNGGKPDISSSLVNATDYAHQCGGKVVGVLGRGTGHVGLHGDAVVVVPIVHEDRVTPHSESWQLAIEHLIAFAISTNGEWNGETNESESDPVRS